MIMVVGALVAATWCLSDAFVQQIVSALMVGLGFGLRDVLMGTLTGLRLKQMLNVNDKYTFRYPGGDSNKFIEGTVQKMALLTVDLETDNAVYTVPWLNLAQAEVSGNKTDSSNAETNNGLATALYFPIAQRDQ